MRTSQFRHALYLLQAQVLGIAEPVPGWWLDGKFYSFYIVCNRRQWIGATIKPVQGSEKIGATSNGSLIVTGEERMPYIPPSSCSVVFSFAESIDSCLELPDKSFKFNVAYQF